MKAYLYKNKVDNFINYGFHKITKNIAKKKAFRKIFFNVDFNLYKNIKKKLCLKNKSLIVEKPFSNKKVALSFDMFKKNSGFLRNILYTYKKLNRLNRGFWKITDWTLSASLPYLQHQQYSAKEFFSLKTYANSDKLFLPLVLNQNSIKKTGISRSFIEKERTRNLFKNNTTLSLKNRFYFLFTVFNNNCYKIHKKKHFKKKKFMKKKRLKMLKKKLLIKKKRLYSLYQRKISNKKAIKNLILKRKSIKIKNILFSKKFYCLNEFFGKLEKSHWILYKNTKIEKKRLLRRKKKPYFVVKSFDLAEKKKKHVAKKKYKKKNIFLLKTLHLIKL